MIFEVEIPFDMLIDKETFIKEYNGDINKLCRFMIKNEGITGWYNEELEFKNAEII